MQKPRSPFLMPPGDATADATADRYSPGRGDDWNEIPPWRQASFFGIRARGQLFVYVVDCSGSMVDDDRLARATIELRRSVFALQTPQRFEVIFYNEESIPMPGGPRPRPADPQTKNQLLYWLRLIEPDGGTDPRPALKQALAMRPDAVFLLSDGLFPEGTADMVTKLNTRKIPIHCVDLAGGLAGDDLKRIAQANGGRYASRPRDLHGDRRRSQQ
jgi:Mg-chelatase subunit ChlD